MNKEIKKVTIIVNLSKKESINLSKEIRIYLMQLGIESELLDFDGFGENKPITNCDLVITLGGDGTVLYAARNCVSYDVPIFPINLGQFGFMAPIQQNEWKVELDNYLKGKAPFQERCIVEASLYKNSKLVNNFLGLNDVVVSARNTARTLSMEVFYNNDMLCKLKADGLIVCTPTGSTAYSASAGGPIVDPVLDAFILTPVNSFSLSSRPIVLSPDGEISINILPCRTEAMGMIIDGQEPIPLETGDVIKIRRFGKKARLICSTQSKFYDALRSKLNWRGEPYA
ncbi:MAG: NAD(+)/NADH kinase [Treponema sp.]|nr:NAD(+)/NADH kinase [Treponema sp.]